MLLTTVATLFSYSAMHTSIANVHMYRAIRSYQELANQSSQEETKIEGTKYVVSWVLGNTSYMLSSKVWVKSWGILNYFISECYTFCIITYDHIILEN